MTKRGQDVTMSCEPISGHDYLYWYRQTSVDGIKFLIYFTDTKPLDDTGMPNARFSAEMPNGSFSTLKIQSTDRGLSHVPLCQQLSHSAAQSPTPCAETSCFPFSYQPPDVQSKSLPALLSAREMYGFGA